MRVIVILGKNAKRILQRFSAALIDMTVQAPGSACIVESWPDRTDSNLIGMLVAHFFVKCLKVVLAPLASVTRPTFRAGMDPGILSVERRSKRRGVLILVKQYWGLFALVHHLSDLGPVGVAAFRKYKDDRPV